jgi:hypothetical protein
LAEETTLLADFTVAGGFALRGGWGLQVIEDGGDI